MADFFEQVLSQLKGATGREKAAIRAELEAHLADHAAALEAKGCPAGEAAARAQAAMGDPAEIGRALNRLYTPFWLWAGRAAGAAAVLFAILLLLAAPVRRLGFAYENWVARSIPEERDGGEERHDHWLVSHPELRARVGTDEVYIYRVELEPQTGELRIFLSVYDRDLFGKASQQLDQRIFFSIGAEPGRRDDRSSGGSWSYGAGYRCLAGTVPIGTDRVTVWSRAYGDGFSLEVPLDWEGGR